MNIWKEYGGQMWNLHIDINVLKFEFNDEHDFIELTSANMLSYIKLNKFKFKWSPNEVLSVLSAGAADDKKWT